MMTAKYQEIQFSDADVVNPDGYDRDAFRKDGTKRAGTSVPWLIHDHGFPVCVVFASHEQDALDEAVDGGKMDRYQVADKDVADYGEEEQGITRLGNASEPFDIESVGLVQLPNPPFSFVALFNAATKVNFTPDPKCDNCGGTGQFAVEQPCHFCLSDAIRRGELDGVADGLTYKAGKPV